MDEDYIKRNEHEECMRRLDAENARQNSRIADLEETTKEINSLTVSVEKLAVNMQNMLTELTAQGSRLKTLESRDGDNWRKIVGSAITVVVGAVLGFFLSRLGM